MATTYYIAFKISTPSGIPNYASGLTDTQRKVTIYTGSTSANVTTLKTITCTKAVDDYGYYATTGSSIYYKFKSVNFEGYSGVTPASTVYRAKTTISSPPTITIYPWFGCTCYTPNGSREVSLFLSGGTYYSGKVDGMNQNTLKYNFKVNGGYKTIRYLATSCAMTGTIKCYAYLNGFSCNNDTFINGFVNGNNGQRGQLCTFLGASGTSQSYTLSNTKPLYFQNVVLTDGDNNKIVKDLVSVKLSGLTTSYLYAGGHISIPTMTASALTITPVGVTDPIKMTPSRSSDPGFYVDLNGGEWQTATFKGPTYSYHNGIIKSDEFFKEYVGPYESTNRGNEGNNTINKMYIHLKGYERFTIYVASYGETNYDFIGIPPIDSVATPTISTTSWYASTKGKPGSLDKWSSYMPVTFENLSLHDEHIITVCYRKDGSSSNNADRGAVIIPYMQPQSAYYDKVAENLMKTL